MKRPARNALSRRSYFLVDSVMEQIRAAVEGLCRDVTRAVGVLASEDADGRPDVGDHVRAAQLALCLEQVEGGVRIARPAFDVTHIPEQNLRG